MSDGSGGWVDTGTGAPLDPAALDSMTSTDTSGGGGIDPLVLGLIAAAGALLLLQA